jgi:hypothetical protein
VLNRCASHVDRIGAVSVIKLSAAYRSEREIPSGVASTLSSPREGDEVQPVQSINEAASEMEFKNGKRSRIITFPDPPEVKKLK